MSRYQQGICALLISTTVLLNVHALGGENSVNGAMSAHAIKNQKLKEEALLKLERLKASAKAGQEQSQIELGLLYANGDEIPKDLEQAVHWLLKAANQGKQAGGDLTDHPAVVTLMIMIDQQALPPKLHATVDTWLKSLGNKLPKLDFSPPKTPLP